VWACVHTGSRNIGKKIGDYFSKLALEMNEKWYSEGRDSLIPFLPVHSEEGQAYLCWLDFALRFAFMSRQLILEETKNCLKYEFPNVKFTTKEIVEDTVNGMINIHHNYTTQEHIWGKDLWIHRKGAILARNNTGIIPGSMGSPTYITKALNNPQSLYSSSHGAGRKMGRRAFCRKMKNSYAQIEKSLEGVVHSEFGEFERGKDKGLKDVSESPKAYKDIKVVMERQKELVEIIVEMGEKPLICLKG
jgi:tRNA-splicing ligase RtcB